MIPTVTSCCDSPSRSSSRSFGGAAKHVSWLKCALRTEIDEQAWDLLYGTRSRPFPLPKSGKIAVKVINHYGDEVLKVFEVET